MGLCVVVFRSEGWDGEAIKCTVQYGFAESFVGMITDSRSFLSYPRHEYFRRILCDLFGDEIENGELPNDMNWTGKVIQDICFYNAQNYFGWKERSQPATTKKPPLNLFYKLEKGHVKKNCNTGEIMLRLSTPDLNDLCRLIVLM
jgi:hypothetical protein